MYSVGFSRFLAPVIESVEIVVSGLRFTCSAALGDGVIVLVGDGAKKMKKKNVKKLIFFL